MTRTDEAEAFFRAVYRAVQEIPPGKVTSYGHIAKLIGTRVSPLPFSPSFSLSPFTFSRPPFTFPRFPS